VAADTIDRSRTTERSAFAMFADHLDDMERVLVEQTKRQIAEHYQVRLGSERALAPEILFDPTLLGITKTAGLGDAIRASLESIGTGGPRRKVLSHVHLCGGTSHQPGMRARVLAELRANCPSLARTIRLTHASEDGGDAWRGARAFSRSSAFADSLITQGAYLEHGAARLLQWDNLTLPFGCGCGDTTAA